MPKKAKKIGAFEYLEKPFSKYAIINEVEKALKYSDTKTKKEALEKKLNQNAIFHNIKDENLEKFKDSLVKIGENDENILINFKIGQEIKEIAQFVHNHSPRKSFRFVSFNSFNTKPANQEIFLFGKANLIDNSCNFGAIDLANSGTLFIHEITDLTKDTQKKLIEFIKTGKFKKINHDKVSVSDVKIIASTKFDLDEAIKNNLLLKDFAKLMQKQIITIPNTKELFTNFENLVNEISYMIAKKYHVKQLNFTENAIQILKNKNWQKDIKEIYNFIDRLYLEYSSNKELINSELLKQKLDNSSSDYQEEKEDFNVYKNMNLKEARNLFESKFLLSQLKINKNNISRTAKIVGMERSALHRKLKSLNIN